MLYRVGTVGLAALAAADAALLALLLHHSAPPRAAQTHPAAARLGVQTPAAPAPAPAPIGSLALGVTPSGAAVLATAGERCTATEGQLRIGTASHGIPVSVLSGLWVGSGQLTLAGTGLAPSCTHGLWTSRNSGSSWSFTPAPAPGSGVSTVSAGQVWDWPDESSPISRYSSGPATQVASPCHTAKFTPAFLATEPDGALVAVCAQAPVASGQARLLYGRASPTGSWSLATGAVSPGPDAPGRVDGLDGTGWLTGLAATGGNGLVATLTHAGCPDGQLRLSDDLGWTWRPGGCTPDWPHLRVSGSGTHLIAAGVIRNQVVLARSDDGGHHWVPVHS